MYIARSPLTNEPMRFCANAGGEMQDEIAATHTSARAETTARLTEFPLPGVLLRRIACEAEVRPDARSLRSERPTRWRFASTTFVRRGPKTDADRSGSSTESARTGRLRGFPFRGSFDEARSVMNRSAADHRQQHASGEELAGFAHERIDRRRDEIGE